MVVADIDSFGAHYTAAVEVDADLVGAVAVVYPNSIRRSLHLHNKYAL